MAGLFNANAALTVDFAATGGLWIGELPEDKKSFPICVLVQVREVPEWNTENQVVAQKGEFEFHVFQANDLPSAESLAADIMNVFDPTSTTAAVNLCGGFVRLPVANCADDPSQTGNPNCWCERMDYQVRLADERNFQQYGVFEVILPYKTEVYKLM